MVAQPAAARKAFERVIGKYGQSEHFVAVLEPLGYLIPRDEQDALLTRIGDGNQHAEVKAAVLFYRAKLMKGEARVEARLADRDRA